MHCSTANSKNTCPRQATPCIAMPQTTICLQNLPSRRVSYVTYSIAQRSSCALPKLCSGVCLGGSAGVGVEGGRFSDICGHSFSLVHMCRQVYVDFSSDPVPWANILFQRLFLFEFFDKFLNRKLAKEWYRYLIF